MLSLFSSDNDDQFPIWIRLVTAVLFTVLGYYLYAHYYREADILNPNQLPIISGFLLKDFIALPGYVIVGYHLFPNLVFPRQRNFFAPAFNGQICMALAGLFHFAIYIYMQSGFTGLLEAIVLRDWHVTYSVYLIYSAIFAWLLNYLYQWYAGINQRFANCD
ncbi:hypothetical protein [Kiloniella sp.]|uniref:hypothetical protein n=1 Tax=Kiloniella sp. TaxID=1938587 RepID=UPI003B0138F2